MTAHAVRAHLTPVRRASQADAALGGGGARAGAAARRRAARAQLPAARDPGRRRPHRRLAGAVAASRRRVAGVARSCSAACTSWPRRRRSSRRTRPCSSRTPRAGCSLADSITADSCGPGRPSTPARSWCRYVNTTAAVKAETDVCCTSSNAVEVVASIPADREVLFLPDQFLGAHVQRVTGRENMHVWAGECHVHAGHQRRRAGRAGRGRTPTPSCSSTRSAAARPRRSTWRARARCPPDRVKILSTGGMLRRGRGARRPRLGAGGHRDRDAAPAPPGRAGDRLPGGERPGVLPLHEDDHSGGAAAVACATARTRCTSTPSWPPGPRARCSA